MGVRRHFLVRRNDAATFCTCAAWLLGLAGLMGPGTFMAAELPPPETPADGPAFLFLELVINGRPTGELVEVLYQAPNFEIAGDTLRRLHIRHAAAPGARQAVNQLPGVATEYDGLRQVLRVNVPPEWLPLQPLGGAAPRRLATESGQGLLLNYDLYATSTSQASLTSVWTEQRYFSTAGIFSNTGVYRHAPQRAPTGSYALRNGYVRHDTRWTRADPESATELSVGDLVTGALPWSTAVRLGGVQWARNFGMRPDLITYPLPQFAGQAAVPSALELFINGFRTANHQIAPGPFTLGDLPMANGAGTASVVTTDALGRQVQTTVPFYVSSQLLRPGWTDYAVALGALRRDYGLRSFAYGPTLASGVYRAGLSEFLTLEGQAQIGRGLTVLGLGSMTRLGQWGIANLSLTRGHTTRSGSGWQYSAGYQYSSPGGGISIQQTGRTPGYGDASTHADDRFELQRRVRQIALNRNLGTGALTGGWIDTVDAQGSRNRLLYAGYSAPLGGQSFITFTAGRSLGTNDTQLRLQWTYLLGQGASAQLASRHGAGLVQTVASYQQDIAADGGLGWTLAHSLGSGGEARYRQASVLYRNSSLQLQGGFYGTDQQRTRWAGAMGSLGLMDGHLFAANRVTDGFALVSTQGEADVPVHYEHQLIGRTNAQGYLLVPNVPSYYLASYSIDPLALPTDTHAPALERRLAVPRGAGTLVELPVFKMRTATLTLLDAQEQPLPQGSAVQHLEGDLQTVVGWDGMVYLPALHPYNTLWVRAPSGLLCYAAFSAASHEQGQALRCTTPTAGELAP